ncbi:MAG: DUF6282 family protein [Dehalococcoidia bacterium]|nr:DUF6282 family protein [Dehalococcoidia bacterium]
MIGDAREILSGAIDLHVHSAPDTRPRKGDDFEIARRASDAGMKAVVLKSHLDSTASRAELTQKLFPGVSVFGGIVLNYSCGGLNPLAVEVAVKLGAKIVWMPTVSAANNISHVGVERSRSALALGNGWPGISIVDDKGRLVPEVSAILEIIARSGVILATGHLSRPEVKLLVSEARKAGVDKILVNHPELDVTRLSLEDQKELAAMGAYFERCFVVTTMPSPVLISEIVSAIREVGPQYTVMSTDFGQTGNAWPSEGLLQYIESLLSHGMNRREIELMVKSNPAALLGI